MGKKNLIVYLIHFHFPYRHAKHYLGSTTNLAERFKEHLNGQGAVLTRVVGNAGIGMSLVRIWHGDRKLERKLKNRKEAPQLCPICNPKMKEYLYTPKEVL